MQGNTIGRAVPSLHGDGTKIMPQVTICAKCKHANIEGDVWYIQFCGHPDTLLELTVNPVTGKKCYGKTNDIGGDYYTSEKRQWCRDINKGSCELFEEKTGFFARLTGKGK